MIVLPCQLRLWEEDIPKLEKDLKCAYHSFSCFWGVKTPDFCGLVKEDEEASG